MRAVARWAGIAVVCLIGLAVIGYGLIYVLSERVLRRTYAVPTASLTIPTDAQSIQEGRRLATVRGCFMDCHGDQAQGRVMLDDPKVAHVVAPNLTAAVHAYSDAQLAAIIRHGIRPDGRSLLIMPVQAFNGMTDADVARIIAFLRSLPAVPGPGREISIGPIGRLAIATGKFETGAERIAATVPPPAATDPQAQLGRYLARTVCAECHGTDLRGDSNPEFTSPDLVVVASYSPEEFARLLRTGIALGGRDLGMMSEQARNNLSHLTDEEISALYSYLHALPAASTS